MVVKDHGCGSSFSYFFEVPEGSTLVATRLPTIVRRDAATITLTRTEIDVRTKEGEVKTLRPRDGLDLHDQLLAGSDICFAPCSESEKHPFFAPSDGGLLVEAPSSKAPKRAE